MHRLIVCLGLLGLAGCGARLEGVNQAGGMINAWDRTEAFQMADAHCHQYGRLARLSNARPLHDGSPRTLITFDCLTQKD